MSVYDVAIVGGGPAGLTAAQWLGRYLRSVVLVDSGDPRNWQTRGINGYLGLPGVTPAALRGAGRDEARKWRYPADDLAQRLGCERNDEGCVVVDDRFETTVADVYAAGDITPGTQIARAAASGGAKAAMAIHHSLRSPELRLV